MATSAANHINFTTFAADHMGMFVIAPQTQQPISSDHHSLPSSAALGVGLGIFPLLAAAPYSECANPTAPPTATATASVNANTSLWSLRRGDEEEGSRKLLESSLKVCEDCGNRAKKECNYRRCRTCCRSRGYNCSTHVKSTWVPAAVRREKKAGGCFGAEDVGAGSSGSGSSSCIKKTRVVSSSNNGGTASHNSISNAAATTSKSFDMGSYHQDASFKEQLPRQVRAPAAFRCVRVTALNDGEAEFVYQATVNISGHVFKGFLYDHGVDEKNVFPRMSELHLNSAANGKNRDSSSPVVDLSNVYGASGS